MNEKDDRNSTALERIELCVLGLRQDMQALRLDLHYLATKSDLAKTEGYLSKQLNIMAATLDQVLQAVTEESTLDDSIIALLEGIKKQLDDIIAGALPAAVQAKVDAVFAAVEANKAKVSAAITANTPAAPTP